MTFVRHSGVDVLPWFQPVSETALEHGTRLYKFADYHAAPIGTLARFGRKGGIGQRMKKMSDNSWAVEGASHGSWTNYGMELHVSHVEVDS